MRLLLTVLVLALAAPVTADEEPHITDRCGDAVFEAEVGEERITSPDPLSPSFDIAAADLTPVSEGEAVLGVDLTMRLCGDAVEPGYGQHYAWAWAAAEEGCRQTVRISGGIEVDATVLAVDMPLRVSFSESCAADREEYGGIVAIGGERHRVDLDPETRLRMDGDTLTVALRAEDVPEGLRGAVEEGSVWSQPEATAHMGTSLGIETRGPHGVNLLARGGADHAGPGRDFVVGG